MTTFFGFLTSLHSSVPAPCHDENTKQQQYCRKATHQHHKEDGTGRQRTDLTWRINLCPVYLWSVSDDDETLVGIVGEGVAAEVEFGAA